MHGTLTVFFCAIFNAPIQMFPWWNNHCPFNSIRQETSTQTAALLPWIAVCSNFLPFPREHIESFPRCYKGGKHKSLTKWRSNQLSNWERTCL